jgi:long-chain fatty acid transport protein
MKNRSTLLKSGIALSLLASTLLHATNGDNLISVGAKARGMGGTGIALSHGAESSLNNPALITSLEGTEISFGGTLFMPDIHTSFGGNSQFGNPGSGPGGMMNPGSAFFDQNNHRSEATRSVIPSVSIAHKINENWYVGIGMFGTAGMGTDYRNAGTPGTITPPTGKGPQPAGSVNYGNFNMVTNLQLMQFAIPIAYKNSGFSIALTPILQYGNLDMNFKLPTPTGTENVGNGLAQDFGFGWSIGASYDFASAGMDGLTIGAVYKSSIEMEYNGQIASSAAYFGLGEMGDTLEQPAEFGIGLSYVMGQHTFAFDYKNIQWSDTLGYGYVGWEDQDVFAFGYQYAQDNWAIRAGYNYGESPVVNQDASFDGMPTPAAMKAASVNFFNLLGFPATAEQHYTLGGSYALTEAFSIDLAYVYSPTSTKTFDLGVYAAPPPQAPGERGGMGLESITTEHQENSVSFQLTYAF